MTTRTAVHALLGIAWVTVAVWSLAASIDYYRLPLFDRAYSDLQELQNGYAFIFAGGVLPTAFLESCGIAIDTKFGEPI